MTSLQERKQRNDKLNIAQNKNVLVEADKTRNFYNLDKESYNNLLEKEIHKDYKKAAEKDSKTAESWLS